MYKTLNRLNVYITGVGDPYAFIDDENYSNGTAALMQVKNCRDIDTILNEEGVPTIIPYHAIDIIEVLSVRTETEDPVDDNCNTGGGEVETGTLTIRNPNITTAIDVFVRLGLSEPATYSGIEFSVIHDDEDTFIRGTIPSIAPGESFVLEGIPVGTFYTVASATEETRRGSVPAEVFLDRAE